MMVFEKGIADLPIHAEWDRRWWMSSGRTVQEHPPTFPAALDHAEHDRGMHLQRSVASKYRDEPAAFVGEAQSLVPGREKVSVVAIVHLDIHLGEGNIPVLWKTALDVYENHEVADLGLNLLGRIEGCLFPVHELGAVLRGMSPRHTVDLVGPVVVLAEVQTFFPPD